MAGRTHLLLFALPSALLLLLLPHSAAAVSLRASAKARWLGPEDLSSFVTDDGLQCLEGPHRELQAALATYKAKPIGKLFIKAKGERGVMCHARGYTVNLDMDPCDPNLQIHVKNASDGEAYKEAHGAALKEWRERHGVEETLSAVMEGCSCHPHSKVAVTLSEQCKELEAFPGAWVHHSDIDGHELMCDQGPFVYALRTMAVLKSTAQLQMHLDDQIVPKTCPEVGFPAVVPKIDHCFPKMRIATRTDISSDIGVKEAGVVESRLFKGGFEEWGQTAGLDLKILFSTPGCHCLPDSEVGRAMARQCSTKEKRSPVRDYWEG